jgi:hypothetical protein
MSRLWKVWDKYAELLTSLKQVIPIMEQFEPVLKPILEIGFSTPPLQHYKYADPVAGLPSEEWEHGHARYQQRERLRSLAQELSLQFTSSLHPVDMILQVRTALDQIAGGEIWAFFARVTQRVASGTSHVFERHLIPENLKELLSDSADVAFEKADLPNPLPVLHVFTAIFAFIQRKDRREKKFNDFEDSIDTAEFLATYFSWWTDGVGREVVEGIVSDYEKKAQEHEGQVQRLLEQSRDFVSKMAQFKALTPEVLHHPKEEHL